MSLSRLWKWTFLDRVGQGVSFLCVIHCLLTPLVLSFSAVTVHLLPSDERVHRVLAIAVGALGVAAITRGFRRHRRWRVVMLAGLGLSCIWGAALWGDRLVWHGAELAITMAGSVAMVAAHRLNHTFCASCECAGEAK